MFHCRHLDETETLGLAGDLVADNVSGGDLPKGLESLSQIQFRGVKRQISYINIHFLAPY